MRICTCRYIYICSTFICTGWRRLIGCLKLQVISRKRATNYRALLPKMTYADQASYESTPPCNTCASRSSTILTRICVYIYIYTWKYVHANMYMMATYVIYALQNRRRFRHTFAYIYIHTCIHGNIYIQICMCWLYM